MVNFAATPSPSIRRTGSAASSLRRKTPIRFQARRLHRRPQVHLLRMRFPATRQICSEFSCLAAYEDGLETDFGLNELTLRSRTCKTAHNNGLLACLPASGASLPLEPRLEPYIILLMITYKRNQLEDPIARLSGEPPVKPSTELLTRIKRLLDTNRALEVRPRSQWPELANHAFFSGSSPGKGTEVRFSGYEAFALALGLQMLGHKWPQKFVVETLRRLRPELEKHHEKIRALDPRKLFDEDQLRGNAGQRRSISGPNCPRDFRSRRTKRAGALMSTGWVDDPIGAWRVAVLKTRADVVLTREPPKFGEAVKGRAAPSLPLIDRFATPPNW